MKTLIIIVTCFTLVSCFNKERYADKNTPLDNCLNIVLKFGKQKQFIILSTDSINDIIKKLNNAPLNGPWKGANWDTIELNYADSSIHLKTNGKVFGNKNSGKFYNLPEALLLKN